MLNITFNHDVVSLIDSISADDDALDKARSIIHFHALSQPYIIKDLYGIDLTTEAIDDDDPLWNSIPPDLRTKSSVLEKCFRTCTTDEEQFIMLFLFESQRKTAIEIFRAYETYSRVDEIIKKIADEQGSELNSMQQIKVLLLKEKLKHLKELDEFFKFVKASSGSYDIFKALVPDNNPVQYLLGKLSVIMDSLGEEE
jgi:hypothetical protein